MLNAWAIILILWSVYRVVFKTDLPLWFDEFVAKPFLFLIPIYAYLARYENGNYLKALDLRSKRWLQGVVAGSLVGGGFLIVGFVTYFMRDGAAPMDIASGAWWSMAAFYLLVAFATSISEEIVSRGFVLKRLYASSKQAVQAVFFSSFLFFFLHIPMLMTNQNLRGNLLLQTMATDLALSFVVSFFYLQYRSLWPAIIIHACYSFSFYLFLLPS